MNTNMANQIAAGFESLVPWVTVNKNVDRIIYVHYNFQNLTKLIRDAKGSLSEQLAATSQMILQNRTALDMVFAEKGGVLQCLVLLVARSSPKILHQRVTKLVEDSGINNP